MQIIQWQFHLLQIISVVVQRWSKRWKINRGGLLNLGKQEWKLDACLSLFVIYTSAWSSNVIWGSNYQQCVEKSQLKDNDHFGHTRWHKNGSTIYAKDQQNNPKRSETLSTFTGQLAFWNYRGEVTGNAFFVTATHCCLSRQVLCLILCSIKIIMNIQYW